jgi:hypothetical protein
MYTEEMIDKISREYVQNPTKDTVLRLSEETGKSTHSIRAKLSSLGIYKKAERLNKLGEPVIKKEEFVKDICTWLGVEVPSLVEAKRLDLQILHSAIKEFTHA